MLALWRKLRRIRFLRKIVRFDHMIVLHQNLGSRALPCPADDFFVFVVRAVDVEDQQVGLERIEICLRGLHEHLRSESAQRAVLNDEIRVRKPAPQALFHELRPLLLGDGLPVKQNAHGVAILRRAGRQQSHRALDVSSPTARIGESRRRIRWRFGRVRDGWLAK